MRSLGLDVRIWTMPVEIEHPIRFEADHQHAACDADFGEFLLPYETVRQADAPDDLPLEFLQNTYEAAADLGRWDRVALERT